MIAGDIYSSRKIRLIDVAEPKLAPATDGQPGQIIFQPELGCLCGSDLVYFEADYPEFPPQTGHSLHELIGTVVDTTGDRFRRGDRVLCVPHGQRGLFERIAIGEDRAIPLDPRPAEEHALMAQPLGTVIHALRYMPNVIDLNTVVIGQGPIGQLFCAALRNLGARRIIAIDPLDSRLKTSPMMGATDTINPDRHDAVEQVRQWTNGSMADLVVEAVGHRDLAMNLCIDLCATRGRILGFGLSEARVDGIQWKAMHWKNITVQMAINPDFTRDFPLAMRWIAEERIDVVPIITHRFAFHEIQAAFDMFHERRDGALKVLVEFSAHA